MNKLILCFGIFCLIASVAGHFRLRCPVPRSSSTAVKTVQCGTNPFGSGQITTIAPGPFTIVWEELIDHIGSPFRIAISYNNDTLYDSLILLNHIPHNDIVSPVCQDTGLKLYAMTIDIPNINCPSCAIQVIQPMTDKIPAGTTCTLPGTCTTNTNIYTSCADIVITGSIPVESFDFANFIAITPWAYSSLPRTIYGTTESGTWNLTSGMLMNQTTTITGVCASNYYAAFVVPPTTGVMPPLTTASISTAASTTSSPVGATTSGSPSLFSPMIVILALLSFIIFILN